MPKAKQESSEGLSIELNDSPTYYTIGSNVSGDVVLNTAEDFAIGSVSLEFYGRVKVYYVQSHGQGESPWRGRAPLFSESTLLYEGFHTHKPGSFRWPFTFVIPTSPDITAIKQSKHQWDEKRPFLSTEDYIAAHPLPPTFDYRKLGIGFRWHIFVEYVLKVEVKQAEGSRVLLPPSCRRATLPILVEEVSREDSQVYSLPLAAQFSLPNQPMEMNSANDSYTGQSQLRPQVFTQTIRASRLLEQRIAGKDRRSSFSIREKTLQVFNSSSLPRYTFEIRVSTPQSIQLLRQDAIPFVVSVSTNEDADNTTIQPDNYPEIRIDNVSIYLTAITHLRCKGPFRPKPTQCDIELLERKPVDHVFDVRPKKDVGDSGILSRNSTREKGGPGPVDTRNSVDISKLPGCSIAVIAATLGKQTEKPLIPSFNTYIIAREYKLKWKLELDVAGEKVKLRNKDDLPVKLLPPDREDLNAIMLDGDITKAMTHGDDDEGFDEHEASGTTSLGTLFKLHKGKKTKQEEAEEDREVAARPSTSTQQPLRYRQDEMLPRYDSGSMDFGYHHEIDDGPPQYEKERYKSMRSRLLWNGNSTKPPIVA